jgi:hypothetical protein
MNSSIQNRKNIDLQLLQGLEKHWEKGQSMIIAGKKYTLSDIVALLERRAEAAHAVITARAAWAGTRKADEEVNAETTPVVAAVRQNLLVMFSNSPDALADFGLSPRRAPKGLTGQEMVQKAEKAKATREARHTMGRRQKQAIVGEVGNDVPVIAPPAVPIPSAGGS